MSGGHFNYKQYQLEYIADEIYELIEKNNRKDKFGDAYNYPPEIIEKFKETVRELRRVAEMVHRIDWLVSGDDSEETFKKLWKERISST